MSTQQKAQVLQTMLSNVKPKARYTSQMHVEDFIDEIQKEIVNGDINIPQKSNKIEQITSKKNFESQIRTKFLTKVEKQKQLLEHKLNYVNNSINSIKKYQKSKGSPKNSSRYLLDQIGLQQNRIRDQQWQQKISQRSKSLQQKRRKIQQLKRIKQQQLQQQMEKKKQQQINLKKKQIFKHMQIINSRSEQRQKQIKKSNEKLKEVLHQKPTYQIINERYHQRQNSMLDERKKKLAEIRSFHKPIDIKQIMQHQQRVMLEHKQKQEMRVKQIKMNQSRSLAYQVPYQSVYYKKLLNQQATDTHSSQQAKMNKMRQFSQHVRTNFVPKIDENKHKFFEEMEQKQQQKKIAKQEKQKQLLGKNYKKGLEYLEIIRNLPKKKPQSPKSFGPKTERIQYPNYLSHSGTTATHRPWKTILKSKGDSQQKAYKLFYEAQKMQQQLKRKQQMARVNKQKDTGDIDQQYFQMIKAKLDLLQQN